MTLSHNRKQTQSPNKKSASRHDQDDGGFIPQAEPAALIQKAQADAASLSAADVIQLQRTIGNHAVSQIVGGQPVQRLMGLANFKTSTSVDGKFRWKIKTVDRAVSAYHDLAIDAYQARATQLGVIIARGNTYLGLPDDNASRKPGTLQLVAQAQKEKAVYDSLVLYNNTAGRKAKYDELNKAQDLVNDADTAGCEVDLLYAHISDVVGKLVADIRKNEPAVLKQIIQDDLAKLQAIALAPNTPLITQRIIAEVLGNRDDINFEEFTPGAKLTTPKQQQAGVTEKYTVNHMLSQGGGTSERIGSLAHELTHVSSGESFDNTPLFLLYPPDTTAEEITAMAQTRKAEVLALKGLYANDAAFSGKQKSLIASKLDYAMQNKLGHYASTFFTAGKIDLETKNKMKAVAEAIPENNTLIEYDSVMNQCLIYMQQWNIPQTNAFYVKLMQVAQDAYNERDDAR